MKLKLLRQLLSPTRQMVPHLVLLSTLLLTAIAAYYVESSARTQDRLRFETSIQRTENLIRDHVKTYIALLRAGSGLFAAQESVTREEFHAYAERLQLREEYPGIQGIGFTLQVRQDQKDELVARMQAEGWPNFTIRPEYPRPKYHSIIYLEPLDRRNQAAIGYDMFSEPTRRAAMEKARDGGKPFASGRVTLVQEIDVKKQAGFLIYYPVYEGNVIPRTVTERREKLKGFVYSPFRIDDLMQSIFGRNQDSLVNFEVYDGLAVVPRNLLHRSNFHPLIPNFKPLFQQRKTITIAGQTWTIVYTSRPELDFNSESRLVPYIVISGTLVSFILFGLMRSQAQARRVAEQAANELRESEQALRESEARFQAFMDYSPALGWICDRESRMIYCNKSYLETLNIPENFRGKTIFDLFEREVAEQYIQTIRAVADENRVIETIESAPRRDGKIGEFLVYKFPIEDAQGQRLVGGVALDRTESRRAEVLMRRSEMQYRTMIEQSPLSILILSLNGNIIRVNRAWETLWGITWEDIKNYNIFSNPQLRNQGIMPYIQRGCAGEVVMIPPMLYNPHETFPGLSAYSHSERWVQSYIYPVRDEVGKMREVVVIHEDITERKQAEEELQESEARFRTLIETTFDGIVIHEQGIIVEANNGAALMFGYTIKDMIGFPLLNFVAPESHELVSQNLKVLVDSPYEAIGIRKDGTLLNLEMVGRPHVYKGRQVRVTALRDITSRKQLEAQLRSRAEQLAEANRLKDEFLATLSHELRTPLNAMLGWTQMLMSHNLNEMTFRRATETIHRNTRTLTQMIEDLLDVSRVITGKLHLQFHPVPLIPIIEAAVDTVRPAAQVKRIQINLSLDPSIHQVLGDASRLQQVMWNLLTNAVKFTPEGGTVEIRLQKVERRSPNLESDSVAVEHQPLISAVGSLSIEYAEIQVSDTGQGIHPDFLPFVFERFRQADGSITREHGGLGLGLAIVRHLVELHGGQVKAQSLGLGKGSTFTLQLPLISLNPNLNVGKLQPRPEGVTKPTVTSNLPPLKGLRLLVVDDDEDSRDLIVQMLESSGAEALAVRNADEAIRVLKTQTKSFRFDVLISDIGMPETDGYSLLHQVRLLRTEEGGNIIALALTAYAKPEDREKAFLAGFQGYLTKPVEETELITTLINLTLIKRN